MTRPLRIALVDDEAPARARLRDLLSDIAQEVPNEVVVEAADGVEALERLSGTRADVALVDIRMPRMDGIELAGHLAALPDAPAVIFSTAYDRYAVQAFELNAIDYLLKPVRAARLAEALRKARRLAPESPGLRALAPGGRKFLRCLERGRVLLVPAADVLYFRADQKYVTARTAEREYLIEESLAHLEAEYGEALVRIHRNCLVARSAVAGWARERDASETGGEAHWVLLLRGVPERLPVSRRQWPQVKELIGA